jgi:hypothetical protein
LFHFYNDCAEWGLIYPDSKITVEELGEMINNGQKLLSTLQQQAWLLWLNEYIRLITLLNKKNYLKIVQFMLINLTKLPFLKGNLRTLFTMKS